jgi:hypothetical protein
MPLAAPTPWDAFALELWAPLLNGGVSVVVEEPYLSGTSLKDCVAIHGVETVWLTSSLFNMIVDEDPSAFSGVRQLMIGGERLSPAHVARFLMRNPEIVLLNGYGPVESTVFATAHRVRPYDCERESGIPVGRPVPGTRILVLDGVRHCGVGETGEICIAGDGLALRYVDDAARTRARFPMLDIGVERTRVYRTGDLGFRDDDGVLHFVGRGDRQVKIRGHRVEPAEIECQVLETLSDVRSCRVLARRNEVDAADELLVFCVPKRSGDPLDGALAELRSALVRHECPIDVISLPSFPLTPQGKLDERALLALAQPAESNRAPVPARTGGSLAAVVAEVFEEVIGRGAVAADVSFFELGGSSLGAGRVCARLGVRIGGTVPLSWLYEHSTAATLAAKVARSRIVSAPSRLASDADAVPLAPMELVFLMRHLSDPDDRTGHCINLWCLRGQLDRRALSAAIAVVHRRHPALRSAYTADPHPSARIVDVPPPFEILPAAPSAELAAAAVHERLAARLELADGEVWRVVLAPVEGGEEAAFGLVVHHIAFDGWSEAILTEELGSAYAGDLEPLRSYFTLRQIHDARTAQQRGAAVERQRRRLQKDLATLPELAWPSGAIEKRSGAPGEVEWDIGSVLLDAVDAAAAEHGVTRFTVLLHRWTRALAATTGDTDLAVGVPMAQRANVSLERAIGCHINMLCIRMSGDALEGGPTGLLGTGTAIRRAFAAQDVSFPDLVRLVGGRRLGRPPVFQTLFSLHDTVPATLTLRGAQARQVRQPYLELPLELVADVWPESGRGPLLVVSYRRDVVPEVVARACVKTFEDELQMLTAAGRH